MSKIIGKRFKVLSQIGSGSIGDVFLARDLRKNEDICLKVVKAGKIDTERGFDREFEILSQLKHPSLVPVYDYGVDPENGSFFSMEYFPGGDLGGIKDISTNRFISIANSICRALDYIHSRGIIHGDLKPANILIGSDGNCRLVDFGLSFLMDNKEISSSGSAAFISPEIIRKKSATKRSDIYSLGLLFYELIFGKPLYEGSAGEIISKKLGGEIALPEISAEFGGNALKEIFEKMINVEPGKRYHSAGAVLDDINSIFNEKLSHEFPLEIHVEKAKFTGRESEIKWLSDYLNADGNKKKLVSFVGGEPGVGKSRLIEEFRVKAQIAGFRFFQAHCREDDLKPLSPVISLLRHIFIELDPRLGTIFSVWAGSETIVSR